MTTAIKRRRGTTVQHSTFTGLDGEITIDTTKKTVVVHDGATAGGTPLAKETQATSAVAITGGTISGITDLAVADGGTGASTAANARTNLGVTATGTDTTYAYRANNLSDLASASTARSNLGLGTAATSSTGDFLPSVNPSYTGTLTGGTGVVNLGSGQFYKDASGNIGIGTSSPTVKLQVAGDISSTDGFVKSDNSSGGIGYIGAVGTAFRLINLNASGATQILGNGEIDIRTAGGSPVLFSTSGLERMRIDSSGNVGIGTSSPAYKLDIQGATGAIRVQPSTGTNSAYSVYQNTGNILYVGVDNSAGTDFGAAYSASLTTTGAYPLTFRVNNAERMRIDSTGNVGIGTSSPAAKLDVRKTSFTPTTYATPALIVEDATTWSQSTQYYLNNAGTFFSGKPSGAIGAANNSGLIITGGAVITDNPDSSNGYTASTTGAAVYRINNFLGAHVWYTNSGLTAGNTFTATERMRIDSSGNLLVGRASYNVVSGIISGNAQSSLGWSAYDGTNTASYISDRVGFNASTYYVINQASTGVQLTNGSTAWAAQSDETVKDIIEPIVDAAKKVSTLRAVIGKYKKDKKETRRSFLIAQDVQKVLPEAVDLDESDNTLSLRYTEVIPLLVAAIQEQQTLINNLTTRLNALEGK